MQKIKAAVLVKKKTIKILELETCDLRDDQVLIKNYYASLCKTQVDEWLGIRANSKFYPNCFGHEAISRVVKTGKKITHVKKGDYVCASWIQSDAKNVPGTKYLFKKKKIINAGPVNTFSTYSVVAYNRIYKIKKNEFKLKTTLMGCAAFTAFNIIMNNLKLTKNKKICVIGIGGVGLSCLLILRKMGIKKIIAFDIVKKKIILAKKIGFKDVFNSNNKSNFLKIKNIDAVIDCSGNDKIINKFFPLLKTNGGKYILASNTKINSKFKLNTWDVIRGRSISGAWVKSLKEYKNFYKYKKIFFKIKDFDLFFTNKTYKLKDIQKAMFDLKYGKVLRPLIKLN